MYLTRFTSALLVPILFLFNAIPNGKLRRTEAQFVRDANAVSLTGITTIAITKSTAIMNTFWDMVFTFTTVYIVGYTLLIKQVWARSP